MNAPSSGLLRLYFSITTTRVEANGWPLYWNIWSLDNQQTEPANSWIHGLLVSPPQCSSSPWGSKEARIQALKSSLARLSFPFAPVPSLVPPCAVAPLDVQAIDFCIRPSAHFQLSLTLSTDPPTGFSHISLINSFSPGNGDRVGAVCSKSHAYKSPL